MYGCIFYALEWTGTLLKFLKDQLPKLQDYYSQNERNPNTPATNSTSDTEQKLAIRHWTYCTQLLKYMCEEGL